MARKSTAAHTPSAETIERERRALELRRAGATFDSIAQQLGFADRSGARYAFNQALTRTLREPAAEARQLEADRLDRLQLAIWAKAMNGDLRAVEHVLKIMERRARLLGLDHADGIAERSQQLDEFNAALALRAFLTTLDQAGLDTPTKTRITELLADTLHTTIEGELA